MRFYEIIQEAILNELKMSPAFLEKLASKVSGALVGMEFEMIVPGVAGDDHNDDRDAELNYDLDRRIDLHNIFQDLKSFFTGEEDPDMAMNAMSEDDFMDVFNHMFEEYGETFEQYREDNFIDWFAAELWDDTRDDIKQEIIDEYGDELGPGELHHKMQELHKDNVERAVKRQDATYQEYLDRFNDEEYSNYTSGDSNPYFRSWMKDEGLINMSDFEERYHIDWPYYTYPEPSGSTSMEEIGENFSRAIGRPINVSSSYHGGTRDQQSYTLEPDSSLDGDGDYDVESGLEFISPPLPLQEMVADLHKVMLWAKQNGCYTNGSTGLHMNVSVPGLSDETLDYVKLALFLGDNYILDQFGRVGNTYCKSALDKIKTRSTARPDIVPTAMEQMRQGLNTLAGKIIHNNATDKYTSINVKAGGSYVEIRSPGGDWLNTDSSQLLSTLYRIVVALDAASNPDKYKQEYATKFYKLLSPEGDDSAVELFTRYNNGMLTRESLKVLWAEKIINTPANDQPGKKSMPLANKIMANSSSAKSWWKVGFFNTSMNQITREEEFVASTKAQAITAARVKWGLPAAKYPDNLFSTKIIKPFKEQPPTEAPSGRWGRWLVTPWMSSTSYPVSARNAQEASEAAFTQHPEAFAHGVSSVIPDTPLVDRSNNGEF